MIKFGPIFELTQHGEELAKELGVSAHLLSTIYEDGFLLNKCRLEETDHTGHWQVIDRWYHRLRPGGVFPWDFFLNWASEKTHNAPKVQTLEYSINSLSDLDKVTESLEKKFSSGTDSLSYRGQTSRYFEKRKIGNPYFKEGEKGEELIIPSWFRPIKEALHDPYIDSIFDGIGGAWQFPMSGLVMRGLHRRDGKGFARRPPDNLDDLMHSGTWMNQFVTVLQHYGCPTPGLDITFNPHVAAFFSTHKVRMQPNGKATLEYHVSNGEGCIYVFRTAFLSRTNDQIKDIPLFQCTPATRVTRQECSWLASDSFTVNAARGDLVARIHIMSQFDPTGMNSREYYFPSRADDPFYDLLMETKAMHKDRSDKLGSWRGELPYHYQEWITEYAWA